jgi:hypothetical protein
MQLGPPSMLSRTRRRLAGGAALLAFAAAALACVEALPQPAAPTPPPTLQATGLYSDFAFLAVDAKHLPFEPQYPLWTDGATKRRWISLPPGTAIDASDPEAWSFPAGTRLWKEFSFGGQRIETRYLERLADGRWLYAAYAWTPDGRDAPLAPARGKRNAYLLVDGRAHAIPGVSDCRVCHQGGRSEVLGFSALQLSPDRDPNAVHAEHGAASGVDLAFLVREGLLVGLPAAVQERPPRIAAKSAEERAALGYLHGNCGHCHNPQGSLQNLGLFLRHALGSATEPALATTFGQPVRKPTAGQAPDVKRIEAGQPDRSGLVQRVGSRDPVLQMPPLGTELVDDEAVALLRRWIAERGTLARTATTHTKGGHP